MSAVISDDRHIVFTTDTEQQQARGLGDVRDLEIRRGSDAIPDELRALVNRVLQAVADGGTLTIGSMPEELTTTVAAKELGISRPTLMKMIHADEIPARRVGTHHRVKSSDITAFKEAQRARQREALHELQLLSDELDF